jgi:hypothetical protein
VCGKSVNKDVDKWGGGVKVKKKIRRIIGFEEGEWGGV